MRDIPTLGGLLAYRCAPRMATEPAEEIRAALRLPRHHLLPLVDLPARKWLLKALRKTDPSCLLWSTPERVKEVLATPNKRVQRWLQHLPRLRLEDIEVLISPEALAMSTFGLLADDDDPDGWPDTDLSSVLEELAVAREQGRAPMKPARFAARAEVLKVYEAITPRDWGEVYPGSYRTPTGDVVLPGTPPVSLRPLRTATEMREHGLRLGSCLASDGSYPERAHSGTGALYVVSWAAGVGVVGGELTATLSLVREPDMPWQVDELLDAADEAAPGWLVDKVGAWLTQMNATRDGVVRSDDAGAGAAEPEDDLQMSLPFTWRPRAGPLIWHPSPAACG